MLKDLLVAQNSNVYFGKLGDILEKSIGKSSVYVINWGRKKLFEPESTDKKYVNQCLTSKVVFFIDTGEK